MGRTIEALDNSISEAIMGIERLTSGSPFYDRQVQEHIVEELLRAKRVQLELIGMLHGVQAILTNPQNRGQQ